ncbi:MAG TPA: beta-N-acetylglucosaminidase domain-containing protein [Cellvibrionaceae bacterium]
MNTPPTPPLGVIEGFFGASWHWECRQRLIHFLHERRYSFYIYAPKDDACLRRHWRQSWPDSIRAELEALRAICRHEQIAFGIGLSPLDLCHQLETDGTTAFEAKIRELNQLQPDILCLLFDDMRGDIPHIASTQAELIRRATALTTASRVILCPTYYSDDPVLEKVFGPRPANYWTTLKHELDPQVDIFWTGPSVCSDSYPLAHLDDVGERLGRQPVLWDNYPVNDGAVKSRHLHLRPFAAGHAQLPGHIAAHVVNPMNQFWLSLPALASLPLAYEQGAHYQPQTLIKPLLHDLCGQPLGDMLLADLPALQDQGLDSLSHKTKQELLDKYCALPESGFSRELINWLNGKYAFDPACLTD